MTPIRRSAARLAALLSATLLLLTTIPVAIAQDETSVPVLPTASIGAVQFGGVLAPGDGRDPGGTATLTLGTSVDGLAVDGARSAFRPDETAAFRLALPKPLVAATLHVSLVSQGADGVESIAGAGEWLMDPTWDTLTGTLPAPPPGEYALRVFRDGALVAQSPIATYDVPRVVGVVTDPLGVVVDTRDQVSAAADRFAEASDGQLWLYVTDTTGGVSAADFAHDLWAVNEDQMWPGDALAVLTTSDADVAVRVGDDLGFYIQPQEVVPIEDGTRPLVAEGRPADAFDMVADGLVTAFDSPPPKAGATPTPRPSPTPETVRTPDFVGLTRIDAQATADEHGLRLRVMFEETDSAPQGTVIAQDPRAGRPVAIGGRVTITVASQPAQVSVPDVVDVREDDAINTLLDAGLEPGTRTQRTSDSIDAGRVISTNPRAGVIVEPGSSVDFVVSRGPAATPSPTPRPTATPAVVTIPDVRGLSEADALTELGAAGLKAGERTRKNNSKVGAGDVISTDPAAGVQVKRGTAVDYVVSKGPAPTPSPTPSPTPTHRPTPAPTAAIVTVPQLRGMAEADALTELAASGLKPGTRVRRSSSSVALGAVISTDPKAGVQVARGSAVDYVVSKGPAPTPTATPAPSTLPGDLLSRVQAAGQIVVNVDPADAPWSSRSNDGTYRGYDVDIAKRLASALGVEAVFTSYPLEQVVTGNWAGRFDIAMQRLAVTDERRSVLDFSAPYAFDPTQLIANLEPAVSADSGDAWCAAQGSAAEDWLNGSLPITEPPLEPATPPADVTLLPAPNAADCIISIASGDSDPTGLTGGLVSLDAATKAIAEGAPIALQGDPVFYAPVGAAADRSGPDAGSLMAEIDAALGQMRDDGTLTARSQARFDGLDLSQVAGGPPVGSVPQGGDPAFTVDQALLDQFPTEAAGASLEPLAMNGADLDLLLVPTNTDVSDAYLPFSSLGSDSSLGLAGLGLVSAPVVSPDGSAMLTAARMEGMPSKDLAAAITPLFTNQYRDPRAKSVTIGDRTVTRISDGSYAAGDQATFIYRKSGVVWIVAGAQPLVDAVLATLP
jgi:beta-lactam-binding protein with PASTA domain